MARLRVVSDGSITRIARACCLVAAPAALLAALRGAARLGSTPGEIFLGVLGGSCLSLLLVILGLVLPRARTGRSEA
jgi:hypothetical protein